MTRDNLVGKYRLIRRIGRGAMGEVWSAVNTDTDREVALKFINSRDPELLRRMLREARAIGRLEHTNIVQILDRGETPSGDPFLVMQLLHGETLAERLQRERALPQVVAVQIALDIARALHAAHTKGVIHRDLKPANIFLHREPGSQLEIVKVVDFGVSKLESDGVASGAILGSPAYMSPEQAQVNSKTDGRADIWALGVVLFEMLAGRRPFTGQSMLAVLGQVATQPAPRLDSVTRHIDRALADIVAICLEREPANRFTSAADLAHALRPFATQGYRSVGGMGRSPQLPTFMLETRWEEAAGSSPPQPSPEMTGRDDSTNTDSNTGTIAIFPSDSRVPTIPLPPTTDTGNLSVTRPRFARATILRAIALGLWLVAVCCGVTRHRGFMSEGHADGAALLAALLGLIAFVVARLAAHREKTTATLPKQLGASATPGSSSDTELAPEVVDTEMLIPLASGLPVRRASVPKGVGPTGTVVMDATNESPAMLEWADNAPRSVPRSALDEVSGGRPPAVAVLPPATPAGLLPAGPQQAPVVPSRTAPQLLVVPPPSLVPRSAIALLSAVDPPATPPPVIAASHLPTVPPLVVVPPPAIPPLPATLPPEVVEQGATRPEPQPAELPVPPIAPPPSSVRSAASGQAVVQVPELVKSSEPALAPPPSSSVAVARRVPDSELLAHASVASPMSSVPQAQRRSAVPIINFSSVALFEAGSQVQGPVHPLASQAALSPALESYISQAGFHTASSEGRLHFLRCNSESRFVNLRLVAIVLEDGQDFSPTMTMSTDAFRQNAQSLEGLKGTSDNPWHVLAVFRSQPAAGVYRVWHDLGAKQHLRILAMSPRTLRAAVESASAQEHLERAVRRSRSDPFDIRDAIDDDLQFFGAHDTLRDVLHDVTGGRTGLGMFGLDKWGTSSLLRRIRLELADRHVAYVDLLTLREFSTAELLLAITRHLLGSRDPDAESGTATSPEDPVRLEDDLRKVIVNFISADGTMPVILLDHVDELLRPPRGGPGILCDVARLLYRLSAHEVGQGRVIVVVGGQDDSIVVRRGFSVGGTEVVNPLWQKIRPYYTPFFTKDELGDFFLRLGGMVGMSLSAMAIDEAFRITGGHKYLTRRLGSELFAKMGQAVGAEIDLKDVRSVADLLLVEGSEYLCAIFERMPDRARALMSELAGGFTPSSRSDPSSVSFLRRYGLISTDGTVHGLSIGLFAEWIMGHGAIMGSPTHEDVAQTRMLRSTFIIYGTPDEHFARKLYGALNRSGVATFFFAEHAVPGEELHGMLRKEVNKHDRIILVCSRESLDRKAVQTEIEEVLAREFRDGGAYLIPIRLDDYVFSGWKPADPDRARAVRDRVVADFEGADTDQAKFDAGVKRLIEALRK
jgi:serine/threonine protein kinase